jgi:hypothetical protein
MHRSKEQRVAALLLGRLVSQTSKNLSMSGQAYRKGIALSSPAPETQGWLNFYKCQCYPAQQQYQHKVRGAYN